MFNLSSPSRAESFYANAVPLGNGYYEIGSFGPYYDNLLFGWIFEFDMGWLYSVDNDDGSAWFYDEEYDWIWVSLEHYPAIYSNAMETWLYVYEDTDPVLYYRFSDGALLNADTSVYQEGTPNDDPNDDEPDVTPTAPAPDSASVYYGTTITTTGRDFIVTYELDSTGDSGLETDITNEFTRDFEYTYTKSTDTTASLTISFDDGFFVAEAVLTFVDEDSGTFEYTERIFDDFAGPEGDIVDTADGTWERTGPSDILMTFENFTGSR